MTKAGGGQPKSAVERIAASQRLLVEMGQILTNTDNMRYEGDDRENIRVTFKRPTTEIKKLLNDLITIGILEEISKGEPNGPSS